MLESEWREKLQEHPSAPGTAETGEMEMVDGFGAEPGMCQCSLLMPWALPEARPAGRAGAGNGCGAWQRGTALVPNPRAEPVAPGTLQEMGLCCWKRIVAPPACGILAWGCSCLSSSPLSPHLQDQEERKIEGWAVCCLVAQGHRIKGEEGAVLFWAASSSIPRGGILPLECWLLRRKDLKTTYTKIIIKT